MGTERAIATIRESTVAILRYRMVDPQLGQAEYSFGSGFVVVANRYAMTAFHVLNGGQPRNPKDRYVALVVPGNDMHAHFFPIVGYALERPDVDLAVVELGTCTTAGIVVPGLPISCGAHPDGSDVVTVGFPSPEVHGLNINAQGDYVGGNFFLKSHANEGIVAAQYALGAEHAYEFNVTWHVGESGGAVALNSDAPAAIAVMQHYRKVAGPDGVMDGPRRGYALAAIQSELRQLGANIV